MVDYVERVVKPQFFTINGIAKVDIYGSEYAMRIWLDPDRMAAQGLSTLQVMAALKVQITYKLQPVMQTDAFYKAETKQLLNAKV